MGGKKTKRIVAPLHVPIDMSKSLCFSTIEYTFLHFYIDKFFFTNHHEFDMFVLRKLKESEGIFSFARLKRTRALQQMMHASTVRKSLHLLDMH